MMSNVKKEEFKAFVRANPFLIDIINNSIDKPYIKLSDDIFKAISDLKDFNYQNIYNKESSKSAHLGKHSFIQRKDQYI